MTQINIPLDIASLEITAQSIDKEGNITDFNLRQTDAKKKVVAININILNANCHKGTPSGIPNTIRLIITTGEVNGTMLPMIASVLLGLFIAFVNNINEKKIGIIIGIIKL